MTPTTEAHFLSLLNLWQKRLGLDLWEIHVSFVDFGQPGVICRVHKSTEYNRAMIEVKPWLLEGKSPPEWECGREMTSRDVEETIVHELLHLVTAKYWMWVKAIEPDCHRDALDATCRMFDVVDENIVDSLAIALVRAFGQPNG